MNTNRKRPNFALIFLLCWMVPTVGYPLIEDEESETESEIANVESAAFEQNEFKIEEVQFEKVVGEPVIDGDISDAFWKQGKHFVIDMELYPTRFSEAIVKTDVWIAVGDTQLFLAFNAHDPDPSQIRSAIRDRDGTKEDDYVSLIIDPTGKLAKKYELRINPHGVLSDVLQDVISDRYIYDWNIEYRGEAKIYDQGYTAELAIPFESIKFPEYEGEKADKWVVVLKRTYPRRVDRTFGTAFLVTRAAGLEESVDQKSQITSTTDENAIPVTDEPTLYETLQSLIQPPAPLSVQDEIAVRNTEPVAHSEEISQAVSQPKKQRNMTLVPHYIYHLDEERSAGESFKQVDEHNAHEVGLDANFAFSRSQQLALTLNPNFTDVEADIVRDSINNPFVKQQPEKRRFFLSGFEMYNTAMPAVYTRNVIRPIAGVSYTLSGATHSGGFFAVSDQETEVIMPDNLGSDKVELVENSRSAAFRYNYSINRKSVGLLATLRSGDNYHNAVGGVDGIIDLGIDDKIRYQLLVSDTQYPQSFGEDLCEEDGCTEQEQPENCELGDCDINPYVIRAQGDDLQGHALRINYKHDGPSSLYWFNYYDVAQDFRADLGFSRRTDVRLMNFAFGRKWYVTPFKDDGGKSRIRGYLVGQRIESQDHEAIEDAVTIFGEFRGSYQTVFRLGRSYRKRAVNRINQNTLELGDNAPRFDERFWSWNFEISPVPSWTFNLDGRYGEIADAENLLPGTMTELKPKLRYNYGNVELFGSLVARDYDVDDGELYRERFFTLRMNYRRNKRVTHRLIYLEDIEKRNLDNWVVDELAKEIESTLEYTYIYNTEKDWSFLTGFKMEQEDDSETNHKSLTNREVYFKVEYRYDSNF